MFGIRPRRSSPHFSIYIRATVSAKHMQAALSIGSKLKHCQGREDTSPTDIKAALHQQYTGYGHIPPGLLVRIPSLRFVCSLQVTWGSTGNPQSSCS